MKLCRMCGIEMPFDCFHRKGKGYQSYCKGCNRVAVARHRLAHPEMYRMNERHAYFVARKAAIEHLGAKCLHCGNADIRVLEIDHTDGGGHRERSSKNRISFWRDITSGVRTDAQVLCANCHRIKTYSPA